jgi:hypothetical protein
MDRSRWLAAEAGVDRLSDLKWTPRRGADILHTDNIFRAVGGYFSCRPNSPHFHSVSKRRPASPSDWDVRIGARVGTSPCRRCQLGSPPPRRSSPIPVQFGESRRGACPGRCAVPIRSGSCTDDAASGLVRLVQRGHNQVARKRPSSLSARPSERAKRRYLGGR